MKYLALLSLASAMLAALLAPAPVLAQRAGVIYPTPQQVAALPRYVPEPGMVVTVPEPLPMALRAQTQRAAPETTSRKPQQTPPRLPASVFSPSFMVQALPDPFAGHPRPDTVTNIFHVGNVKPQLSNPPPPVR